MDTDQIGAIVKSVKNRKDVEIGSKIMFVATLDVQFEGYEAIKKILSIAPTPLTITFAKLQVKPISNSNDKNEKLDDLSIVAPIDANKKEMDGNKKDLNKNDLNELNGPKARTGSIEIEQSQTCHTPFINSSAHASLTDDKSQNDNKKDNKNKKRSSKSSKNDDSSKHKKEKQNSLTLMTQKVAGLLHKDKNKNKNKSKNNKNDNGKNSDSDGQNTPSPRRKLVCFSFLLLFMCYFAIFCVIF